MPEIKNTFTQGKMNKDLDERLVPNGQYRDAMNVQISTSDSSDVGALENILGNKALMAGTELGGSGYCVGTVVDDKTNSLYALIAGPVYLGLNEEISRDIIVRCKNNIVEPVVVDIYRIRTLYGGHDSTTNTLIVTTANNPNTAFIEVGMVAQFDDAFVQMCYFGNNPITNIVNDPTLGILTITLQNSFDVSPLIPQSQSTSTFIFSKPTKISCSAGPQDIYRVLNFQPGKIITGINIINDFLFWTDNYSEPKKINIKNCIAGSSGFDTNTRLIVPERSIVYSDNVLLQEQHVTVIKQAPSTSLLTVVEYDIPTTAKLDSSAPGANEFATYDSNQSIYVLKEVGDNTLLQFYNYNNGYEWEIGDELRLLTGPGQLPDDFGIRVSVITSNLFGQEIIFNGQPTGIYYPANTYMVTILSIDDSTYLDVATYDVYRMPTEKPLFERKFPRFSYRYKYQDGQYSTFAPFSDPIFSANSFEYDSKLAYNLGMENYMKSLQLRGFITPNLPEDVVQIDLLYKESNSPTVYVVDKITPNDGLGDIIVGGNSGVNSWDANLYKVNTDLIYSVVPSNQLLRPWDNVPRAALGQEITGNRVVYANYLQNYNLDVKPRLLADYDVRYDRSFDGSMLIEYSLEFQGNDTNNPFLLKKEENRSDYRGLKTLKSIRDYQLGISYLDTYGRETPVFSSSDSSFYVKKKHSAGKSKIITQALTIPPSWARGFKFYVKETSNEYYNLAMDRVYRAEDGTLWLSFPSSERNKVDENTFLHLKKEVDSNEAVIEDAKYKIVSISNEAPLFIKTETKIIGSSAAQDTDTLLSTSPPVISQRYFEIDEDTWMAGNNTKLTDIFNKMSLDFKANSFYSKKYDVVGFSYNATGGVNGGGIYRLTLDRPIDDEDIWIYPNHPTVLLNNLPDFDSTLSLRVYQDVVENKPEYEGKFFVKINGNDVTERRLIQSKDSITEYEVKARMNTYMLVDIASGANNPYSNGVNTTTGYDRTDTQLDWELALDVNNPEDGIVDSVWFVDAAYYPMTHPTASGEASSGYHVGDGNQNGGFGRGVKEDSNGDWYIELSFSKIKPDMSDDQSFIGERVDEEAVPGSINYTDINNNYIWEIGKNTNPEHVNQSNIISSLAVDSKFRFTGDTNPDPVYGTASRIYTITKVEIIRRYNHERWGVFDRGSNTTSGVQYATGSVAGYGYGTSFSNVSGTSYDGLAGPFFWHKVWKKAHNDPYFLNGSWDNNSFTDYRDSWERFVAADNRRTTYRIYIDKDPTTSSSFVKTVSGTDYIFTNPFGWNDAGVTGNNNASANLASATNSVGIEFLQQRTTEHQPLISDNPAMWETEPKENVELNIYHSASQVYPTNLNASNNNLYVPKGAIVTLPGNTTSLFKNYTSTNVDTTVLGWFDHSGNNVGDLIALSHEIDTTTASPVYFNQNQVIKFTRHDNSYTTLKLANLTKVGVYPSSKYVYRVVKDVSQNEVGLSWYNAFSFSNGVESNRIRDVFNEKFIDKGPIVSTTLDTVYEEERRSSGLIYSGIYNSNSGVNNLNQFIQAEKITKDLNPTYGSIQKLFSRTGDLVSFCEDKVVRIVSNKDALFNADGNPQLIATNRVLGQSLPFSGDYGISKNPESFVSDGFRAYFTDKQRSSVLRLSKDGITNISDYGMGDWFGDNLRQYPKLVGSFDSDKKNYNLTLREAHLITGYTSKTLTYNENVKGWVSFKSFIPEQGASMGNDYYTFKNGYIYKHHDETVDRNTFYDNQFTSSSVNVLLNAESGSVKNYQTLNYEGTKSKVTQETVPAGINSNTYEGYKKLISKEGWYVDFIETNKQKGHVNEFIEKEGKWFNYIKGNTVLSTSDIKTEEFSFQGIGRANSVPPPISGCTDPIALNYNQSATIDDGSCTYPTYGCKFNTYANNYDPTVDIDNPSLCTFDDTYNCDVNTGCYLVTDGTGTYSTYNDCFNNCTLVCQGIYGCTDPLLMGYDPTADCDDGSCGAPIANGCMDNTIGAPFHPDINGICISGVLPGPGTGKCDPNDGYVICNYDPLANTDDGSCITPYFGCTDPLANNYDPCASFLQGCTYDVYGCTDSNALNYNPLANIDNGSCCYIGGCTDGTIGGGEFPDIHGLCVDQQSPSSFAPYCNPGKGYTHNNYDPLACFDDGTCPSGLGIGGCMDDGNLTGIPYVSPYPGQAADNYDPLANYDDASCTYTLGPTLDWKILDPCIGCENVGTNLGDFESEHLCAEDAWNNGTYGQNISAISITGGTLFAPTLMTYGPTGTTPHNYYVRSSGISPSGLTVYTYFFECILAQADGCTNWFGNTDPATSQSTPVGYGGCTDPTAFNYNSNCVNDGSCEAIVFGCTDPLALNYFAGANNDDGSCIYVGCTDSTACNYNPLAGIDDGSCTYAYGCMNPLADNYDPLACSDDGSCCGIDPSLPNC